MTANRPLLLLLLLHLLCTCVRAQDQKITPVVPYGGIYAIPEATVAPDPSLDYRLVIDLVSGHDEPDSLGQGLYNVARMLNLFSVGGVPDKQVEVGAGDPRGGYLRGADGCGVPGAVRDG